MKESVIVGRRQGRAGLGGRRCVLMVDWSRSFHSSVHFLFACLSVGCGVLRSVVSNSRLHSLTGLIVNAVPCMQPLNPATSWTCHALAVLTVRISFKFAKIQALFIWFVDVSAATVALFKTIYVCRWRITDVWPICPSLTFRPLINCGARRRRRGEDERIKTNIEDGRTAKTDETKNLS